ncbi:zinc finger homeobox protein 3-like isoform X2 [Hippocampus comes]|uniref:zinc finger homeobox protein 3-like isoform X2 n=1 Tax=Hippocampus comes TaxID=109280 RepID=UPI00094E1C55|nr:PREDICTED: zinc finger homeobox protein 3-like isoform X2 [Hippocampus comes]
MDIGEGGGGDGGGGEDRDADLDPQALSCPLLTPAFIPEQGLASRTSAGVPAKEPSTPREKRGETGVKGSRAGGETQVGGQKDGCHHTRQMDGACQKRWTKGIFQEEYPSGQNGEGHAGTGAKSATGGLPKALSSRGEEEEAISNQSQTKSKCSLLPQQSQQSASSSTAKASVTLNSKTAESPKSCQTPPTSPEAPPFLSTSPKHFTSPSYSSSLLSDTEAKDLPGDQGWISGFPQSFKSQQSTLAFPLAGVEGASAPAENDGPAGVPHSSISNGDGAKAPEPNDSHLETDMDDERDNEGEQKEAVPKNLTQELSPNSLTTHMTVMHSRNSCKTLKCPKCNWHYKSQHTLQLHMKEKHPETGSQCVCGASGGKCVCGSSMRGVCGYCSSGKPHPRLARGETYACGYKPYRCEVCDYATSSKGNLSIHMQSDKHLNNVQSGGHANGQMHTLHGSNNGSSSSNGATMDEQAYKHPLPIPTSTPQPAKLTPPAHSPSHGKRWRCDVCDYETSIARNLRIHTTSEKHTHNMLRLQRGYYLSHCRSLAPHLKHLQNTGGELSLNMRLTTQQVTEQPVTLGSTLTPSPSPSPSPPPVLSLSPAEPLSQGVFQCLICSCFSSDSLESVEQHLNAPRSLPQSEWCSLVAGGCHCRLCGYTTPLRANFSLHCQTDRHRTRYQLAAHVQEGGERGQEGAALIAKGNPIQLRCNLCEYATSSLEKLQAHSRSSHHESSIRVYRFLQQYDVEVDGGSCLFHCLLCNNSSSSKLQVLKHSQTQTHQQREGLLQLQPMGGEELAAIFTIRKSPNGVAGELNEDMENSGEATTCTLDKSKDNLGEKESETVAEEVDKGESFKRQASGCGEMEDSSTTKRPRTHQPSENQQTVLCPLCQAKISYAHLRPHLTHVHSVAQDCVDKLISTVTPSLERDKPLLENELPPDLGIDDTMTAQNMKISPTGLSRATDSLKSDEPPKNKSISGENTEGNVAAPKDVTALLTPPLEDNTTHPSNGRLAPQSLTHTPPSSPTAAPSPLSDRHGYRFRCSRCSLAFPTQEKLQLHWQYHAMRAATECPLCSRQCRSQEALQRHMQNTHSQPDNTQNTGSLPHMVHYVEHSQSSTKDLNMSPPVGQEAGEDEELEEEELQEEEEEEDNTEGKEHKEEWRTTDKDPATETGGGDEEFTEPEKVLNDEIPSEPSSISLMKKSSNPTMDRYLDPSRPYKCSICSESFTQKTILLVHYNSVSHLHRARRALQESGTGVSTPEAPRGQDPRPYRCKLCGVGYSQSSTLDIHLRSVLHQTRARAAQNPSTQTPVSSVAMPVSATTSTTTLSAITGKDTSKSLPFAKKPDVDSSSPGLVAELQSTVSTEGQQAKKRVAELIASRNQLLLMQQQQLAQAQAQAQLQHTALLQAQVMQHLPIGPESLFQHFSLAPENLLSLQQQLLLPFYFPGDMKLNTELAIKNLEQTQSEAAKGRLSEQIKGEAKKEENPQTDEKHTLNRFSSSDDIQTKDVMAFDTRVECGSGSSSIPKEKECIVSLVDEKEEVCSAIVKNESQTQENDSSTVDVPKSQCPPPRVPYATVNGEALRTLLQSYGYELALQYIQSRHRHQQQIASQMIEVRNKCADIPKMEFYSGAQKGSIGTDKGKLQNCGRNAKNEAEDMQSFPGEPNQGRHDDADELANKEKRCCGRGQKCRDCGKFFSDAMILKSHQEYIHRQVLPTAALERFSREYRLQYDQLYPLKEKKSAEDSSQSTPVSIPATSIESELGSEAEKPQVKTSPLSSFSDADTKKCGTTEDHVSFTSVPSPPRSSSQTQETPVTSTSTVSSQNTSPANAMPIPLPKIPLLPLSQLPIPPLALPKLPLPPIHFPMELPLIPPVVMQPVGLQPQTWLDSSVSPELTKLYQSQLLAPQAPISPTVISQPSQLSPALLGQPPQVNSSLLGQPVQSSSIPAGQQPQVSPALLEQQQGKRTRTRISEDQLNILKKHFDINSLPSDEELNKISSLSGLPHKVIKHWFRNTLFKERQRDKDSPYNFNNPPTTALEESKEELLQNPSLKLATLSPSPAPTEVSHQTQLTEIQRTNTHRGRRSSRTRFTEKQLEMLQGVFEATPYPREEEYDRLSALLSLPNRVIVVWFQNARQRARKSQDRGADDGVEGTSQLDTFRKRDGYYKSGDPEGISNGDEGHSDSQNENSMDLTYEYYTHPDSPILDSSSLYTESDHPMGNEELTPAVKKQENTTASAQTSRTIKKEIAELNTDRKEIVQVRQNVSEAENLVRPLQESSAERLQSRSSDPSKSTVQNNPSVSDASQDHVKSLSPNKAVEKSAAPSPSLPSSSESENNHIRQPDASPRASIENQSLNHLPIPNPFQCNLCPMSLPTFQMWQDHQTRHLLAAQSQVQLLHSGFTDRTLPYMMLHSNHSLMASQMLSGAMTQLHPSATSPMISHLNSTPIKNSLADLSQSSLKQNPKLMSEGSFDVQRYSRDAEEEQRRDKRQRTTITPEQLEVLYQRYSLDSNPTRGVLEGIAQDVGLTRRVVQVWFQNTRARERKGQFRSMGPGSSFSMGLNHLRCPFCRALFKVKSALDAHMRSRHWAEAERAGYNLSMNNGSRGPNGMAVSSLMDKPGPSASCNFLPNTGIAIHNKEQRVKSTGTFLSSNNDPNNPGEYDDMEEDDDEFQCEEGSSMADQGSPSPEGSDWGETLQPHHHQQQRQRTQMSHFQVLQLRDFYKNHRTPNRHECEALGQELGLPHRVVQVWFQNARAKEKRARTLSSDSAETEQAELKAGAGERDRA